MTEPKQTLADAIAYAAAKLLEAGIDAARREAASLAAFALDRDAVFTIAHPEYELSPDESARYHSFVRRRANREPFHYITGTKEFYGLDFAVAPGVLIPRPETELLVEEAIKLLSDVADPRFLEIGLGSGCIAVSILSHTRNARAEGVDISAEALAIAKGNAIRLNVAERLEIRAGDVFDGTRGKFDLIVSNPPYIPVGDLASLQPEVRDFEPHNALFSGMDGLSVVRRLVNEAPDFLRPDAILMIEIGFDQAKSVKELFDDAVWGGVRFIRDFQDIERVVVAHKRDQMKLLYADNV